MKMIWMLVVLSPWACVVVDTPVEAEPNAEVPRTPEGIQPLGVPGDLTLESTLDDQTVLDVEGLSEEALDVAGSVFLSVLDLDGEEHPALRAWGRTDVMRVPGRYTSLDEVGSRWEDASWVPEGGLDLRLDLEPGTAFVVNTFGRQDYLALVVDRGIFVRGRCTEVASLSLDVQPITGFQ